MARRGSYAKGVAKREEILERALEVIGREGYRGASVKEIADAVGLSQAGLLHYFDSKEELFTAILRARDAHDAAVFRADPDESPLDDYRDGFLAIIRHNADVPGLVALFSRLSVDAADPTHPAHAYFLQRSAGLRRAMTAAIAQAQREGLVDDRIDAALVPRMVQALADGMQLQWLLDPEVDMTAAITALFTLLTPPK